MKLRWLVVAGIALIHGCDGDNTSDASAGGHVGNDANLPDSAGHAGSTGHAGSGGVGGLMDAGDEGDGCIWMYVEPGCGADEPDPVCKGGTGGGCLSPICDCDGKPGGDGCGTSSKPFAYWGPCEAAVEDAGDACVWLYDLPGCGAATPPPVCTDGTNDACTLPFCGCDGVTFMGGCGKSAEPFAAYGPCAGDAG